MKKRLSILTILVLLVGLLSGCRYYTEVTVNKDNTVTQKVTVAYTQEEIADMDDEAKAALTLKTLEDGNQYYVGESETETTTMKEFTQSNNTMVLTSDIFYYTFASTMEDMGMTEDDIYYQMTVSLLGDIVDTNANIKTEGVTAVFDSKHESTTWYAYTAAGKATIEADKDAPVMKGAKNNAYYKEMPRKLRFVDNVGVKNVVWNGKKAVASYVTEDDKITDTLWSNADGDDVAKRGKNVIKVTDLNGNEATYTIYIDAKAPTVKGVKNNKSYKKQVTIYVKDSLKLSKVTIDGKNKKLTKRQLVTRGKYAGYYKYTVKKKGTHKIVARDAAGRKTTIKFTIK